MSTRRNMLWSRIHLGRLARTLLAISKVLHLKPHGALDAIKRGEDLRH